MFINTRQKGSYYDILQVDPCASDREIHDSFRTLSDAYHPDTARGNKKLAALRYRLINEAYAALRTEETRGRYNRLLLMRKGAPKGLKLLADNDNRKSAKQTLIKDIMTRLALSKNVTENVTETAQDNTPKNKAEDIITSDNTQRDADHG